MVANNYNGLLRYEGSRNYQASRSGRKLSRRLLGQLENRMNIFGQKFGKFYTTLEDGSTIEVLIDNRSGIPFYQATLIPFIPEDVVVTTEESGLWICFPSSDNAIYGWGDPYTAGNAPLGTIQGSLDLTKHIGRLMNMDGTLSVHGTNLIASHENWYEGNTNVVVSWTRTAIYADGFEIHTDSDIECAALHEMQDVGQTKLFLVWISANTFTLKAIEVARNPVKVVGSTTYSWPCVVDYTMPLYLPSPGHRLYPDLDDEDRFRYWSFSQDGTKLNYTWTYRTSDALNGRNPNICVEYISESWEASDLPTDISSASSASSDIVFTKIFENGPLIGNGNIGSSQKFLLKSVYVNSVITGIWADLYVLSGPQSDVEIIVLPDDVAYGIPCPLGDYIWAKNYSSYNVTKTTTYGKSYGKITFYLGDEILSTVVFSDYEGDKTVRYSTGMFNNKFVGTCLEAFANTADPEETCSNADVTTLTQYFTAAGDCNIISSNDEIIPGVGGFINRVAFSAGWINERHQAVAFFSGYDFDISSYVANMRFSINDVMYSLGTDFGAGGNGIINLGRHSTPSQNVFYMNSNARYTIRHSSGAIDLITKYLADGYLLDVGDSLAFCCGAESDSTELWSWLSYFDDQTTQKDLTSVVEIDTYTNPKIIIDQTEPVTFGLIRQPAGA